MKQKKSQVHLSWETKLKWVSRTFNFYFKGWCESWLHLYFDYIGWSSLKLNSELTYGISILISRLHLHHQTCSSYASRFYYLSHNFFFIVLGNSAFKYLIFYCLEFAVIWAETVVLDLTEKEKKEIQASDVFDRNSNLRFHKSSKI